MTTAASRHGLWGFGRDIAVIILGVLIALAVDGFVVERADRNLERQYLARLVRDLRADSLAVVTFRQQAEAGERAGVELLNLLRDHSTIAPDTVMSYYFGDATRDAYLTPNSPTIQELQSTGNLRVIDDDEVRDALLSYYAEVTRFQAMLETVMSRGKNPLGEVGWDIQAFDAAISHSSVRESDLPMRSPQQRDAAGAQVLQRFRQHPAAERATIRAITYNKMLQTVLALWQQSLVSTLTQVSDQPNTR